MPTIKFTLSNLNCAACGKVSQMKLGKIPGVSAVHLDQHGGEAQGELEAEREISIKELQGALDGTDYKISLV